MRPFKLAAALLLSVLLLVCLGSFVLPFGRESVELAEDTYFEASAVLPHPGGPVRLGAVRCEGVLGYRQRPMAIRQQQDRVEVLAYGPLLPPGFLESDCSSQTSCRVHLLSGSLRPRATFELQAPLPEKGDTPKQVAGLCSLSFEESEAVPLRAENSPLLWLPAAGRPGPVVSAVTLLAPLWISGLLVIVGVRTRTFALLWVALLPLVPWFFFFSWVTALLWHEMFVEVSLLLTAVLLGCAWVLLGPRKRRG
jgi:hypothetical protein